MNQNDLYVIIIGVAIVFIGLVSIIILCKIMSALCEISAKSTGKHSAASTMAAPTVSAPTVAAPFKLPPEEAAVISAVIAEEIGEEASSIRILSVKKL